MQSTNIGQNTPGLSIQLAPGETLRAQAGAMLFLSGDVEMDAKMDGGFMGGLRRKVLTGESLFFQHFTAGPNGGVVGLAAPYPGSIAQLDLRSGRQVLAERGAYLAGSQAVQVDSEFQLNLAGFLGGEGFVLERLHGDGVVWLNGGGDFMEFDLQPGQVLRVDTGCVVYFDATVSYDVQRAGGFKSIVFGGEGLALTTLTGPGKVALQTMPFGKMATAVATAALRGGGAERGGFTVGGNSLGGLLGN